MTTNIKPLSLNKDTSIVTHHTLKKKIVRFIQHALSGFFTLMTVSVALAKDKNAEPPMDPQAMMELYTKLARPRTP